MHEDIDKFLNLISDESLEKMVNNLGFDDGFESDVNEKFITQYRDKLHKEYFSFIDKYDFNDNFFDKIGVEYYYNLISSKLFISDKFYHSFLDYIYKNNNPSGMVGFIYDKADFNYFFNKGWSVKDIVNKVSMSHNMLYEIYLENPEYIDILATKVDSYSFQLVAAALVNDNFICLEKYFASYGKNEEKLRNLITELAKYDHFNLDKIIDELCTKYVKLDELSVIKDEDVIKNLLKVVGSRALIFSVNPSAELVELSDFSFGDYSMYDGSYKNSAPLLLKFLKEGKFDALMYAKCDAINEEVYEIIKENNMPLERLRSFDDLLDSFYFVKYFAEHNDYSLMFKSSRILSSIDYFDLVYSCFKEGKIDFVPVPGCSSAFKMLVGIFLNDWSHFYNYDKVKITNSVVKRLIELKVDVELFVLHLSRLQVKEIFVEEFAKRGEYLPLFYSSDTTLINQYIEYVTYDMYENLLDKYGSVKLPKAFLYKFFKDGHYDVLNDGDLSDYDLENLGLENLTYEEYLKYPDSVRNNSLLKKKFVEYDPSYLKDLLEHNVSCEVLEKAALSGMTFDEIKPYFDMLTKLSARTVLHYLKKGDIRAVDYITFNSNDKEFQEIASLLYDVLDGELPREKILDTRLMYSLFKIYIEKGRYDIIDKIDYFSDSMVDFLLNSSYDFETFKKYPVLKHKIVEKFISLDNEDELMENLDLLLKKNRTMGGSDAALVFLKMYRVGFKVENLKQFSRKINIDCETLLKNISFFEYEIFNVISASKVLSNKVFLSKLINIYSVDKVRELFSDYVPSDSRLFIIRKMVERGHYDFVSFYTDKIEEDVLKRALFGGYFPADQVEKNAYFRVFIGKINLSLEEKDYLKSKLQKDARYIFFFPEIFNEKEKMANYILSQPSIINLLPIDLRNDIKLLKILVASNPGICSQVLTTGISGDSIAELLSINIDLVNFLSLNYINIDLVKKVVGEYPNIVDFYDGYLEDKVILEALQNGYVFSSKSKYSVIEVALRNNMEVPKEAISNLKYREIFCLLNNKIHVIEGDNYLLFREVLDDLYKKDVYEFTYEFVYFWRLYFYELSDALENLLDYFSIDVTKYKDIDLSNKDNFILMMKLNELPKDDTSFAYIDKLLEGFGDKKIILKWIRENLPTELVDKKVGEIAKKYFLEDPFYYIDYVNVNDVDVIETIRGIILEYPDIIKRVPVLLNDKDAILKVIMVSDSDLYSCLSDELKSDFEICSKFIDKYPYLITKMSSDMEKYRDLVIKSLTLDGKLISNLATKISIDEDMVHVALQTYPTAFFSIDDEFFNEKTYTYIKDITKIDLSERHYDKVLKMIHFTNFDISNQEACAFLINYILENLNSTRELDKNDKRIKELFANGIQLFTNELSKDDGNTFRRFIISLPNLDVTIFPSNIQQVLNDTLTILNSTGKLNTLEKNPVFNYNVVKYIYPLFGVDFVKDLIKYNTPAAKVIVDEIKKNNSSLLVKYYKLICDYNIFAEDDKRVHYAFRDFEQIRELVKSILSSGEVLDAEDIVNFRKIILRKNMFNVQTYDDLKRYDDKTQYFWKEKMNSDSIFSIRNVLSSLFGYESYDSLRQDFINFQLNNYLNLKVVREDIIRQYGREKANEIFKECFYTKKDVAIILLMDRVINSQNINELKELMNELQIKKNDTLDYCDDVREIIRKTRLLYNYQFNGRLTKVDNIKSKRMLKDDPKNPYGVTVIEMDSEKFNFLAHRIYSYDPNMSGFSEKLMSDSSLWTKLEGASTLSTSSFSDKGFWFLHSDDSSGVIYLFNNLPSEFLLFMNGQDLYVEHGGYKIEPTASRNSFTNIDALNQISCYEYRKYNEVAGFRDGVLPCAFACIGDVPNEDTIRAAKYFSETLGVDIPIIKFNIKAYDAKKVEEFKKAKEEFALKPNYQAMYNIFFDGIRLSGEKPSESIGGKIDYCLNILNEKYRNKEISFDYFNKSLYEMEILVSQIIVSLPECRKDLSRIGIFRKTLSILNNETKEDVIRLESAEMGESGIMYKYQSGDMTYLVKPSVEKQGYTTQSFRADIQEAASKLQEILSPTTAVKVESLGKNLKLSKQEKISLSIENANVLEDWVENGGELDQRFSSSLLREYVVDFLLCNFDCFVGNFIIDSNDNVRGIDKEQSFRFIDEEDSLKADFSYVPNGIHRIPIYKILFERYKSGDIDLDLSVIADTIEKVRLLTDEEYMGIFSNYAKAIAKDKSEEILKKILKRRDDAIENMEAFVEELQVLKKSGGVTL